MYIPIKDASIDYARAAEYAQATEKVGFLKNVKLPKMEKLQGAAATTVVAFSIIGAGVFTLNLAKNANDANEQISLASRTVSGKVTNNQFAITSEGVSEFINSKQESIGLSLSNTNKLQTRLSNIAGFKLPAELKLNNYPKAIAEHQLNKGEYYLALVSMAEGFSPTIQPDNKGYFLGFGWNLTLNSEADNERIANSIGMKPKDVKIVKKMSHQSSAEVSAAELKSISITPQQGMQAAYLIGEQIRSEKVIPGIKRVLMKHRNQGEEESYTKAVDTFNSLSRYEQDLLVYHGYKAGNQFLTFKNLVLKVVDYAENSGTMDNIETQIVKSDIIKELDYSFQLNGKKIIDKRAQQITSAMFMGPKDFAKELGLKIKAEKKIAPPITLKM